LLAAIVLPISLATCGSNNPVTGPSGSSDDDNTAGTIITGTEKIGWIQPAANLAEARSYTYMLYVDSTKVRLENISCAAPVPGGYDCSAPLPRMAAGRHVLQAVAVDAGGAEGPRSQALVVTVKP
jgi:hypothetical protein